MPNWESQSRKAWVAAAAALLLSAPGVAAERMVLGEYFTMLS